MLEAKEVSNKIVDFLRMRGPSLPIHIAKYLQMNSLFVSAFLSELVDDRRVIVSNMRVGGSPLYLLQGQEPRLDSYHQHLHPKEIEAYLLLKKEGILKDAEQDPAIRVALRAIKDFAIAFKIDDDIYWRYLVVKETEVMNILNKKPNLNQFEEETKKEERLLELKKEPEKTQTQRVTLKYKREEPEKKLIIPKEKQRIIQPSIKVKTREEQTNFENPLIQHELPKTKVIKEKPKSEFVINVMNMLQSKNIRIIEEKEYKAKEYNCISEINSDLGPISFLTQAKDKKSITEEDLKKLLVEAQKIPLPALFIYKGNISKKALEYLKTYSSILKVKSMD